GNGQDSTACLFFDGSRVITIPDLQLPQDINDSGQIVGEKYVDADLNEGAALYRDGKVVLLDDLIPKGTGWSLELARAINNRGQIIGSGRRNDGNERGFLLTPVAAAVPLPPAFWPSLLVIGAGAGAPAVGNRRRRHGTGHTGEE